MFVRRILTFNKYLSVVRAAGTYFPQNSDNEQATTPTKPSTSPTTSINDKSPETTCTKPFCKLKKKVHDHCELCNQVQKTSSFVSAMMKYFHEKYFYIFRHLATQ